jgi:hypothetical protein
MPKPTTQILFEAPCGTIFICEKTSVLIIARDGTEALVPLVDFLGFLLHLSVFQATYALNRLHRCLHACAVIATSLDP